MEVDRIMEVEVEKVVEIIVFVDRLVEIPVENILMNDVDYEHVIVDNAKALNHRCTIDLPH